MIVKILPVVVLLTLFSCRQGMNIPPVLSPDGSTEVIVSLKEGVLKYQLRKGEELLISDSELNIFEDSKFTFIHSSIRKNDSVWKPVWGQFSCIRNNYTELEIELDAQGDKCFLYVRVFDEGIAFRFELPETIERDKVSLFCEYNVSNVCKYYTPNKENEPLGPLTIDALVNRSESKKLCLQAPVVVETANGSFMAFLESDLYTAKGFDVMNLAVDEMKNSIFSRNTCKSDQDKIITPWRVILLGRTAGDLVVNNTAVNLAAPCKVEDTGWIKPGKTLWDWRVQGYTTEGGFTYGTNTESYKRFIDFAAEYNINYFLIDDHWYSEASKGHFKVVKELDLPDVIDYAKQKNVDLLLYYDRKKGDYDDDLLFKYYASLNIKGIKYGFMGSNVPFTREAIERSTKNKLLINFHDGPVPFTGVSRTLPNAVTREYCHAQQDSRRAFTPEAFIKMALINAVTGPLDMNNGNFDIEGINKGLRFKGPRELNSYLTTVVSEAARTLIIFSGLVCLPDAPEAYKAKKDLFEFIQNQPVGKWDESKVLNSSIGEYITTARRSGNQWFIGSVISQEGGSLYFKLDFLEDSLQYDAIFYEDTPDTHCQTNPEAYQVRRGTVKKGDVIKAVMAPGGGHCMWIKPQSSDL